MIIDELLMLNGKEQAVKAPFGNAPRTVSAHTSANGDTLYIDSKTTFINNGKTSEWITNEVWTLENNGKTLAVHQTANSLRGKRTITAVYNKQ